ncbi:beta-glucosidase [Muricoccus nepalensis]|uniref:beta-glucosidase n=1 Tax=Muricoccus nepalensis TaxID=1854500 RepID=UPI0018834BA5|nr:beta-glucosidase [Roseomonas nepalensis]
MTDSADTRAMPRAPLRSPSFSPSFFMGGFECSTHRRKDGKRLDLIASTRHDLLAQQDYEALAAHGIRGARDGARWHLIERVPGQYDWSPVLPLIRAAKAAGVRVAWDVCHYGHPDHVSPMEEGFAEALARFCAAFARLLLEEEGEPPVLCPVNEISFWSWAAGDVAYFHPGRRNWGKALKARLVAASIAAGRAAREAVPGTRLIAVDPVIEVFAKTPESAAFAEEHQESQWHAWEGLLGRWRPELGGTPDGFDLMGVNYYWNNQFEREGDRGQTVPMGDPRHRPLRDLLVDAHARIGRPMILAETSIEGSPRAAWLRYVGDEVRAAMRAGVPIGGICLYPVLSHLGWDDDRYCPNGLFEMHPHRGRRPVDAPLAKELARQTALFDAFLRGEDVPEDPEAAPAFKAAWEHSESVRLSAGAEEQRVPHEAGEHGA